MRKPAVFLAGVGTCASAVVSCSTVTSPASASQSGPPRDSAQSAPGATAPPTIDPDTALTSKNGQSGPGAQSGQEVDSSAVIIAQFMEGTDGEMTLASINKAVASAFPSGYVSAEREYHNALKGYMLRAPVGSIDVIRAASDVQAVYPDGSNPLQ